VGVRARVGVRHGAHDVRIGPLIHAGGKNTPGLSTLDAGLAVILA